MGEDNLEILALYLQDHIRNQQGLLGFGQSPSHVLYCLVGLTNQKQHLQCLPMSMTLRGQF